LQILQKGAGGEAWYEVGCSKTYTPTTDDVGHVLKLECVAVDVTAGLSFAPASTLVTARVIPAPSPTPRCLIPMNGVDGNLELGTHTAVSGNFTVLSYNVLADLYATNDIYIYFPPWAHPWKYRQNLLLKIIGYVVDVISFHLALLSWSTSSFTRRRRQLFPSSPKVFKHFDALWETSNEPDFCKAFFLLRLVIHTTIICNFDTTC